MTMMEMYWITRLDGLQLMCSLLIVVPLVGIIICGVVSVADEELSKDVKHAFKWCIPLVVVFGLLLCLLPTTKEVALIYTVPKILANEDMQELPSELVKLARETVKEYLSEGDKE